MDHHLRSESKTRLLVATEMGAAENLGNQGWSLGLFYDIFIDLAQRFRVNYIATPGISDKVAVVHPYNCSLFIKGLITRA
jgi:hypothetical protein